MGNTENKLINITIDEGKSEVYNDWTMTKGKLENTTITLFTCALPSLSRKRSFIERALQASRIYRHPGLLKYLDGGVMNDEIFIVTEQATPLVQLDPKQMSPLHVSAGLHAIVDTLIFLHEKAGVSHNNLCIGSIFVTSDGSWKLWGLEYSCSFGDLSRDYVERINDYCHKDSVPPDDKSRISPSYQHARDTYGVACLVADLLTVEMAAELPGACDFLKVIKCQALNTDWSKRPRVIDLASHPFFHHEFLNLYDKLSNVLLLPDDVREEFLLTLVEKLRDYPEDLVAGTMGSVLLSRSLLLLQSAAIYVMPAVLTPRHDDASNPGIGLFSTSVFARDIVPPLSKLFSAHDAAVRIVLLSHLPSYVSLIDRDILAGQMLPELLLGIRDSNDILVSATLHALAHLVPILGANQVVGSNRHRIFTTTKPKTQLKRRHNGFPFGINNNVSQKSYSKPILKVDDSLQLAELEDSDQGADLVSFGSLVLDERSAPDGGEDAMDDGGQLSPVPSQEEEVWSDWEEENIPMGKVEKDNWISGVKCHDRKDANVVTTTSREDARLRAARMSTSGLGEEFDIMSIEVRKNHDTELDLFADLAPHFELATKKFDLEAMLVQAGKGEEGEHRQSLSYLFAGMADDVDVAGDNDAWDYEESHFSDSNELEDMTVQKIVR